MISIGLHSSFEQLIQIVCPLHQLECNAHEEQLLELLRRKSTGPESNDESSHEAADGDDDVKQIPAIGSEAGPAKTK